jgi:hypothetical protein
MPQFKDAKGDAWSVIVNGGTIKRALDLLKVDLGDPLAGTPPLLTRFDTDIVFKVDLLYVACLPEAEKRGVSDLEFAERLEGDALYAASEAFLEALSDFFQKLRRTHVVRAVAKQRELVARAVEVTERTIGSPEFDEAVERKFTELGESYASLLRSPGSDPKSTASAS